jgi:two-component system CheB/CheR fusion protein
LLRSTEIGTIFLDRNLGIRKFTPQIARAFDLLPQDVGRRIDTFSHSIRDEKLMDDVKSVLETAQPIEKEVQDCAGNWFLLRILPYKSHSKLDGVVLSLIDVSTLKRTQAELEQMSAIVASSDDAILGMDLEGRVTTWNKGAAKLYGYAAEEVVGRHASFLQGGGDGSTHTDMMHEALERTHSGQLLGHHVESTGQRRDGAKMDLLLSFSPIHNSGGALCGASIIARDISDRKANERELARRAEELTAVNVQLKQAEAEARDNVEKRDHFLAMLSHELRNPLAAILNAANLLQWDHMGKEAMELARGAIARQSQQMARLLDDLLDVSRITRGKIEIRKRHINLVDTSRHALEAVAPSLEGRDLMLEVDLPDEPLPVKGDPARMQQIQVNLLTNAIKYTPPGGRICLSAKCEDDQAVVRVRDTGLGIPSQMRDRIFDLFVQVDDTPGKADGGMGVGLTLVRTLVRLHGGEIKLQSQEGKGSEFEIRFPICKAPLSSSDEAVDGKPNLAGLRVLLVEDHADIRIVTGRLLKAVGCEVTQAEDGSSGLEAVSRHKPDVALIDIGLPDINGYDVARRIRELPEGQDMKLLAVTGFGQPEDRQKAIDAGFDAHLVKPLNYEELVSIIRPEASDCRDGEAGGARPN